MYLHLGGTVSVRTRDVIGLFDLDNTTASYLTRKFLEQAEWEGRLESLTDDIPKAFVLCGERKRSKVYFSQLSTATLRGRAEGGRFELGEQP